MNEVTKETLTKAYKPFDIVTNKSGAVGFIQEVNVNKCQHGFDDQISYAVNWLIGKDKYAWFTHKDLTSHCNLFVKFAESACNPCGSSNTIVKHLFNNMEI